MFSVDAGWSMLVKPRASNVPVPKYSPRWNINACMGELPVAPSIVTRMVERSAQGSKLLPTELDDQLRPVVDSSESCDRASVNASDSIGPHAEATGSVEPGAIELGVVVLDGANGTTTVDDAGALVTAIVDVVADRSSSLVERLTKIAVPAAARTTMPVAAAAIAFAGVFRFGGLGGPEADGMGCVASVHFCPSQ